MFIVPCRYVFLYRKEADQGDATAQFNLGVSYGVGTGVKEDSTRRSSGTAARQQSKDLMTSKKTWALRKIMAMA
jgi:TPR repeat protein